MRILGHVLVLMAMLAGAGISACGPKSDVTIVPPKVPAGGRAVAIAVSQSDAKRLVVATESGGLFRTFDGGVSFQHLDAFPTLFAVDVVMASLDPNIVIATARDDFATTSGGGSGEAQTAARHGTVRPDGPLRDAVAARRRQVFRTCRFAHVSCGHQLRTRRQQRQRGHLRHHAHRSREPEAVFGAGGESDDRCRRRQSPHVVPEQRPMDTVAWRTRRGRHLHTARIRLSVVGGDNIFYHAGRDRRLWVSTTSGGAWRPMLTICDTLPTDATIASLLYAWAVDSTADRRPTSMCTTAMAWISGGRRSPRRFLAGTSLIGGSSNKLDHLDPADIAFTPGNTEPLMLATDGGVHLTKDQGKQWTLTGSNVGGFVALQVGEMTGRQVGGSSPHLDLYYGTQDNDIKGSSDGGATWNGSQGGEGAFLQVDRANPAMVDGRVTGRRCGGCALFDVPPHLGQVTPERSAMRRVATPVIPTHTLRSNSLATTYLQPLKLPPNCRILADGQSWSELGALVHHAGYTRRPHSFCRRSRESGGVCGAGERVGRQTHSGERRLRYRRW